MPSRNIEKIYLPNTYYHLYNRGVNRRRIFLDDQDFSVFLNLLKRYLDDKPSINNRGASYDWLHEELQLLSFCLMPNHFHLLVYQSQIDGITRLLRRVGTSYTAYFNKKYQRIGPLFQSNFKASMITHDNYLLHISRYIHLNPKEYLDWEFSSLPYYLGDKKAMWVHPKPIMTLFASKEEYKIFLSDLRDYKNTLDEIKPELAHA